MGSCRISKWQNGSIVKFTDLLKLHGSATRANSRSDRGRSNVYKQPPSTTLHRDIISIQKAHKPSFPCPKKTPQPQKPLGILISNGSD